MRNPRYLIYLSIKLLIILSVILIFKFIEEKKTASVVAGALFVLMPIVLMWWQYQSNKFQPRYWWLGVGVFFVLFALPILMSRLIFWELSFEEILIFGFIPGRLWHQLANNAYLLMIAVTSIAWWRKEK